MRIARTARPSPCACSKSNRAAGLILFIGLIAGVWRAAI